MGSYLYSLGVELLWLIGAYVLCAVLLGVVYLFDRIFTTVYDRLDRYCKNQHTIKTSERVRVIGKDAWVEWVPGVNSGDLDLLVPVPAQQYELTLITLGHNQVSFKHYVDLHAFEATHEGDVVDNPRYRADLDAPHYDHTAQWEKKPAEVAPVHYLHATRTQKRDVKRTKRSIAVSLLTLLLTLSAYGTFMYSNKLSNDHIRLLERANGRLVEENQDLEQQLSIGRVVGTTEIEVGVPTDVYAPNGPVLITSSFLSGEEGAVQVKVNAKRSDGTTFSVPANGQWSVPDEDGYQLQVNPEQYWEFSDVGEDGRITAEHKLFIVQWRIDPRRQMDNYQDDVPWNVINWRPQ